jgi:hypothetical protein
MHVVVRSSSIISSITPPSGAHFKYHATMPSSANFMHHAAIGHLFQASRCHQAQILSITLLSGAYVKHCAAIKQKF